MPRLSTMFWYLARPTRRITPSLRPPSWYSCTSISTSRPLTSWKPPSPNASPAGVPVGAGEPASTAGLRCSRTRKRKARSRESAISLLHRERAVAVAGEPQQDELDGLRGGHADLGDELSGVQHAGRVERLVAAHEECLLLPGALERAGLEQSPQ